MKTILGLTSKNNIKDKLNNVNKVYFKSGVWNKYELVDIDYGLEQVENSSYGGDLRQDENNNFYICCPSYCDMF